MPEVALAAEGLEKRFGGLRAVAGVSLDVHVGEIHAVIGPNGAGKSTLINLLSGELSASAGTVRLSGRDVSGLPPDRLGLAGLGRSYQKTTIFLPFTVFENVRLAAQARAPGRLRMFGGAGRDAAVAARAREALATVGLEARGEIGAGLLSHGEQRQLEIAMVLATEPRLLLLDEPLAGMGPEESERMVTLLKGLAREHAVLLIEHDMDFVFAVADWMTVMAEGGVIAEGRPETIRANTAVQQAYLGGHA